MENKLEETNELILDPIVEVKDVVKAPKKENPDFLNPFDEGVTYTDFIKAMDKKTVEVYCKGRISNEQIEFLQKELEIINQK